MDSETSVDINPLFYGRVSNPDTLAPIHLDYGYHQRKA
jgi:hypothetical protein